MVHDRLEFGTVLGHTQRLLRRRPVAFLLTGFLFSGLPDLIYVLIRTLHLIDIRALLDAADIWTRLGFLSATVLVFAGLAGPGWGLGALLAQTDIEAVRRPYAGLLAQTLKRAWITVPLAAAVAAAGWIGLLLLIAPGLWFTAIFPVVIAAATVERRGPLGAMNRSRALTKGHRWTTLGLSVCWLVGGTGVGWGVSTIAGLVRHLPGTGDLLAEALGVAAQSVLMAVGFAINGVLFVQLRALETGMHVEQAEAVFG